jgi:pimeloyl-ACP methyl ester carboxylesterase
MSTWILLRGLTREKRHWHGFPQALLRELPDARVVELELPGNGELNGRTSPTSIAAMARHCRAELARLGIPPPYHLLALSMGAMVATAWAESHPDEIEACVLINTSFGAFSPVHRRLRPRAWGNGAAGSTALVMTLGDEEATALGLDPRALRIVVIAAAANSRVADSG